MQRALLALFLLLAVPVRGVTQSAAAPFGTITGQVIEAETGRPLGGAPVAVVQNGRTARSVLTRPDGTFSIGGLEPGSAILRTALLGYGSDSVEVRITPGLSTRASLALSPRAISLAPLEIIGVSGAHQKMTGTATRITPHVVQQIAPLGTQELLQHVPGVSGFADDGIGNSRISIGIRGLNPRRSSRVLFLEDGIPIQPALYVYPNMYYNPPAERIERVEVIKGSAAIRYGPQTMGGVVNYITSRPRDRFGGEAQLVAGTNGYTSLFTELGGWGTRTIQPEVQLLFKRGEGFRENNAFEQYNGTFKLTLLPGTDRTLFVKANVNSEDSNATYTGLTEYSFRTNPNFNPKRDDNFRVFRSSLDAIYSRRLTRNLTGDTRVYLSLFDRRWWRENDVFVRASQYDGSTIDPVLPYQPGDLIRVGNRADNQGILRTFYTLGVEQSYDLEHALFGRPASLNIGVRGHWERFVDDKKRGDRPDARDGVYYTGDPADPASLAIVGQSHHYETTALSLFASERVVTGRLTLVPGVRLEVFEQERIDRLQGSQYLDKTSYVVLPGLGVNYEMGAYHLFGGVHRGYTPPSSGTLKVVNFGADRVTGGLDLRSEKSWNYEVGVRGSLPRLGFEAATFHVAVEDMVAAGRGTAFRNLGRVSTSGVELGATAYTSGFSPALPDLNLSYTYLRTRVDEGVIPSALGAGRVVSITGRELPYAPRHTLVAGISRDLPSGLSLRTDMRYVSEVYTDFENIRETYNRGDTGPIPSYTVVDANTSYRLPNGWVATLGAKNLLDEVYIGSRLHSSPGQPEANLSSGIIPGPRRQITFGLRYEF